MSSTVFLPFLKIHPLSKERLDEPWKPRSFTSGWISGLGSSATTGKEGIVLLGFMVKYHKLSPETKKVIKYASEQPSNSCLRIQPSRG